MADNPFDPKYPYSSGLLGIFGTPPAQEQDNPLARAPGLVRTKPALPVSPLSPAVSDLFPYLTTPSTNPFSNLTGVAAVDLFQPFGALAPPRLPVAPLKAAVKRRAFFSFHYDDIMRVNVVRNAWKIDHPDNALMRSFQDSSLWENRKLEGDDAVKRLIREGVEYTSAVCVLIGTDTWLRRWVKYEIARAIVDGRGLLSVHLNSIRHHHTKTPHTRGYNPLDFMAVGKVQPGVLSTPRYYLFEKQAVPNGVGGYKWEWNRYSDYTSSVSLPPWLADPAPDFVTPLSQNATVYDYIADDGHKNIGSWIDKAAHGAGR
ncbi:TIR domain-containing protein [Bradyrhizobium sp.]